MHFVNEFARYSAAAINCCYLIFFSIPWKLSCGQINLTGITVVCQLFSSILILIVLVVPLG